MVEIAVEEKLKELYRNTPAIDGVKVVGIWQGHNTNFYARTKDNRFWEYDGEWVESDNGRVVHVDLRELVRSNS